MTAHDMNFLCISYLFFNTSTDVMIWLFGITMRGEYGYSLKMAVSFLCSMELKVLKCLSDEGWHDGVSFHTPTFRKWDLGI